MTRAGTEETCTTSIGLDLLEVLQTITGDGCTPSRELKLRLEGINAPELAQPFGAASRDGLHALVSGRALRMTSFDVDKYGRTLARLYLPDGGDVSQVMLSSGLAWHFARYSSDRRLADLQERAREGASWTFGHSLMPGTRELRGRGSMLGRRALRGDRSRKTAICEEAGSGAGNGPSSGLPMARRSIWTARSRARTASRRSSSSGRTPGYYGG